MEALPTTRTNLVSGIADFGDGAGHPGTLPKRVDAGSGVRLLVDDAGPPASGGPFWADYRVYRAALHVPGRRPRRVPVEVELSPWSSGRTEVTLRAVRRLRPEGNRRYFDAAVQAVDALIHHLEERETG